MERMGVSPEAMVAAAPGVGSGASGIVAIAHHPRIAATFGVCDGHGG